MIKNTKPMSTKTKLSELSEKFETGFIINALINGNAITMKDGSSWINWALDRIKDGHPLESVAKIAYIATNNLENAKQ